MPLKKGSSIETFKKNMTELMKGDMSTGRAKAVQTIAKNRGVSVKKARQLQAIAISYSQKRKAKK